MTGKSHKRGAPVRQTFENLPARKQARIRRAAVSEFAQHDYAAANLDRIARNARIAKGSLYQYFSDKQSLYQFAVRSGLSEAARLFEAALAENPPRDCFDMFRRALLFSCDLHERAPDLARLYARSGFGQGDARDSAALATILEENERFQEKLLTWGIEAGDIDPNVDRAAAAFLLDAIGSRFHERILQADPQYQLTTAPRERVEALAGALTNLVRAAIGARKSPRRRK